MCGCTEPGFYPYIQGVFWRIWGKVVIYSLGIRNCFLNYMFHSFERYLQAVKIRQQTSETFVQSSLCSTVFGQLYPNRYADVFFKNFCNSIKYVTWKKKNKVLIPFKEWFLVKNAKTSEDSYGCESKSIEDRFLVLVWCCVDDGTNKMETAHWCTKQKKAR